MEPTKKDGPAQAENKRLQQPYIIPVEGSLGLLALGAAGIKAWREKRNVVLNGQKKNNG